jgi:hypothetical protein
MDFGWIRMITLTEQPRLLTGAVAVETHFPDFGSTESKESTWRSIGAAVCAVLSAIGLIYCMKPIITLVYVITLLGS